MTQPYRMYDLEVELYNHYRKWSDLQNSRSILKRPSRKERKAFVKFVQCAARYAQANEWRLANP